VDKELFKGEGTLSKSLVARSREKKRATLTAENRFEGGYDSRGGKMKGKLLESLP